MTDATRDAAPKVGDKFAIISSWGDVRPATVTRVTPAGFIELGARKSLWANKNGYWVERGASGFGQPTARPWDAAIDASFQSQRRKARATAAIEAMCAESTRSHLTEAEVTTLESILAAAQARAKGE